MPEVRRIKSEELFPVINEIMDRGRSVRITVTGTSMYPFLRDNKDGVELSKVEFDEIKSGDIVLVVREGGQYILHRVKRKKKDCFYIIGDAQQRTEGPLRPSHLVAVVTAVWRSDKQILCSSLGWRALSFFWLWVRPFRKLLFKTYGALRRIGKIVTFKKLRKE